MTSEDIFANRWNKWVQLSLRIQKLNPILTFQLQGLGKIDAQLIINDERFLAMRDKKNPTVEDIMGFTDHYTLSYLWVLGIYEFVRTAHQMSKKSDEFRKYSEELRKIKNMIARIRVPLAKLEQARDYRLTDNIIAFPTIHIEKGVGWRVSSTKVVKRREISDKVLYFMESLNG
jgi:uncharacterized Zn finger protein